MCVISLFSGLFDILRPQSSLKFHPCQVPIPTWPLSHLFCQNLKMSLMSFLTSSLWPFSMRFFFKIILSLSFTLSTIPSVQQQSSTSCHPWLKTTNQKRIKLIFQQFSVAARRVRVNGTDLCNPFIHLHMVLQWGIFHSAPRLFVQVLFRYVTIPAYLY